MVTHGICQLVDFHDMYIYIYKYTIHVFPFFPDIFRLFLEPITGDVSFFGSPTKKNRSFPQDQIKSTYKGTGKCSEPGVLDETSALLRTTRCRCKLFGRILRCFLVCFRCNKNGAKFGGVYFFWAGKKGDFQKM